MTPLCYVVGTSWRDTEIGIRERLACPPSEIPTRLNQLTSNPCVSEALILSTCNRVEVLGIASESTLGAIRHTMDTLASVGGFSRSQVEPYLFKWDEMEAVRHTFSVASSLDSLVVGESQILGQLKQAFRQASEVGSAGVALEKLLNRAYRVAKRVRSETGLSKGAANVSSVAVDLAERIHGDLKGKSVAVVGAGKMSTLAVRHMRSAGVSHFVCINRSLARAEKLADRFGGVAREWKDLEKVIATTDVVITSTGSSEPVLLAKKMKRVMRSRRYEPLVVVDIAVPRDVETAAGEIDGLYLFNVDDLERVVAGNLAERQSAANDAQLIIDEELKNYSTSITSSATTPAVKALRHHFHSLAQPEVDKFRKRLLRASDDEQRAAILEDAVRRVTNKLLHAPTVALKNGDESLLKATQQLFEIAESENSDG